MQNGGEEIIASLYTSNAAFSPQDGTHHGVVFFDTDGNLIADHDLYGTHGVTGPSGFAVDPETGHVYVLVNNSTSVDSADDIVDFGSSAIIEITDPYRENPDYRKISLDGFKNASAIAFRDGKLVVAAANNTLDETGGDGKLLTIDPATEEFLNIVDLPMGVGINGNAPSSAGGELIFTGNNADGESLAVVDADDAVESYLVPSGFQSFVASAQSVGSLLFFNVTQGLEVKTALLDPETGTAEVLDEIPANFGVGPVFVGAGTYCDGAAATSINNDEAVLSSTITCYQAVSE